MITLRFEAFGIKPNDTRNGTRLYEIWRTMKKRCGNPKAKGYSRYGGRGVVVCDQWQSFSAFRDWALQNGYEDNLEIDRKNNDGNYEPENCRWVDDTTQANNRRANVMLQAWGESKTMSQWSRDERCNCSLSTIAWRIRKMRWSAEKAIETPTVNSRRHA